MKNIPNFAVMLGVLFLVSPVGAAVPAAIFNPPSESNIDSRALTQMRHMSDYLASAPFFSVAVEAWQDVDLGTGQTIQTGKTIQVELRRPNMLHAQIETPKTQRELFYDGKAFTLVNCSKKYYGSARISGPLDAALEMAASRFGIAVPIEDFLVSDPYKDFLSKTTGGLDLGAVNVLGIPCEHLAFTQGNIDWQVWVQTGPQPLPRKFVITYKDEEGRPQYTALFKNWDFETKLPEWVFKFDPPPGYLKIDVEEMKKGAQTKEGEKK